MTYRDTIQLWAQPLARWYRESNVAKFVSSSEMVPLMHIVVSEISAILWPAEQTLDEDEVYTYVFIMASDQFIVYNKRNARDLLCYLFDEKNPERDWLKRQPSVEYRLRHDFAVRPDWRCVHSIATTTKESCCIAIVTSHIVSILERKEQNACAVVLKMQKMPLVIETGSWNSSEAAKWLTDADSVPADKS
jgi:hypothetical protein